MIKEIALMHTRSELLMGEQALTVGNVGKARVCARRACSFILSYWNEINKDYKWGNNSIRLLEAVRDELTFPEDVKNAAHRLTVKVDSSFSTGYDENPIADAKMIIEYFLNH